MYDLALGKTAVLCSLLRFMRYTWRRLLCGTPTRVHLDEALV